jgi:hypothetical protein
VSLSIGFKADYDGYSLYAFYDDNFLSLPELEENTAANYLIMQGFDKPCRGNFVFGRFTMDESQNRIQVPMTRREIIEIASYNMFCGGMGTVSDRIHFENLVRAQTLSYLKKESFVFHDHQL